jgi:SAM-dependent methyltransferase
MLARAHEKVAATRQRVCLVRHALPDPLPFHDGTFDLAVLGLVAEHIIDLVRALAEVARVLAPGGRCILSGLHPDRTAEGQHARFIDPETGQRRSIMTIPRTVDDYLAAASEAGFRLEGEETLIVSDVLARRIPRAMRYVGKNLGWVASWARPDAGSVREA